MLHALAATLLLAAPAGPGQAAGLAPEEERAAGAVTEAAIRADVAFLASDLLEGRGPGTRGDRLAQAYLASQLEAMGFEGAAPGGGYLQKVPLVGIHARPPARVRFTAGGKRLDLAFQADFVAVPGVQQPVAEVRGGEVVFAGYGITAPEYAWDDFKGADVRGKVLLVMNNDPEDDPALFEGKRRTYYGRWDYKYAEAARHGAAGVIIIHTTPSAAYPWQVVQTSWGKDTFELPAAGEPRVQVKAWATEEASRRIASLGGKDLDALRAAALRRDFRPVPLGVRLSLRIEARVSATETANVLARLPGSDAALAGEAVLFTAHHDHLGTKRDARPGEDAIYNGAVDNGTGCAAMLGVARAFRALPRPPRRTVVMAFVAAEEQGLLGSEWLAAHPPVPVGRIAAVLNMDGLRPLGRTRDVNMGGLGKSTLDAFVTAAAAAQGRVVTGDPFPERGHYYRSDQFSFAKAGVPAVSLGGGLDCIGKPEGSCRQAEEEWLRKHYHQPSDEYRADWDVSGIAEDARLVFLVGRRIAEADQMPRWNAGDEFEAARQRALAGH
ncbi:MAG TPA: M20/M25/M40 family metallo-hydrolase [Anaeromyxobacteraceae bacterium]|nr:M20/M25/M40 family metallo-hydrolase [Anaeromyxobacteraceae bacterium]